MKKKNRIISLLKKVIGTVVIVTVVALVVGAYLLRRAPDWYARPALSAEQRSALARQAEDELLRTREFAAASRAAMARSATNPSDPANRVAPMVVTLSQNQVNSLFERWGASDWRASYETYISDPAIIFRKDRVIFAGLVKDFGAVVSLHFRPQIDERGELHLELMKVLGGNLPMPESMYARYREKIIVGLRKKLPAWQRDAKVAVDGTSNDKAVSVGLAKMLVAALRNDASESLLFVPMAPLEPGSVPMRITKFEAADGTASLTIRPLTAPERQAMVDRLKQPLEVTTTVSNE